MEVKNSMASAVCKEQGRDRELGWRQGFNYPSHPAPAAKSVMVTLCIDGEESLSDLPLHLRSLRKETGTRMRKFFECFILH